MNVIKSYFKRLLCRHEEANLTRWCIKHIPDSEPSCAVVEYQCEECGKYIYIYLRGKEKADWITAMGEYKHENFYCTR